MERYNYGGLEVELTRKCNMKCRHCMRGDAQEKTMSTDTIDRLIEDTDAIAHLAITGGEPFLEMNQLLYLIQSITNKWRVGVLDITTNGTILDERIISAFETFCNVDPKRTVQFGISKDEYHTAGAHETAMAFYEPLVKEANSRLNSSAESGIVLTYRDVATRTLVHAGRAKRIIAESTQKKKFSKMLSISEIGSHRLKIKDNCVYCRIIVTVDGGVTTTDGMEYSSEDANIIGYLSDDTLSNIIKRFNDSNLLLCSESVLLDWENKARLLTDHMGITEYLRIIAYAELCRVILRIRYTVQKMYGNLAAEDIIRGIQLPTSENDGHVMLALLATVSPYQDMPKALEKVDKQTRDLVKSKWNSLQKNEKDSQYWISDDGTVFNCNTGHITAPDIDSDKYARVILMKNGSTMCEYVHRLVAYHFCPNRAYKDEVHHIDGKRGNNNAKNLVWVTKQEHQTCHSLMKKSKRDYRKYIKQLKKANQW